jgi:hypothetical protein
MTARTFRVFVSSTFSDMKAERNALARWVFPRLRALCEERGHKFQPVDLRWGVRQEAGLDQRTVQICLEEISRCQRLSPRPNFIALLGDRYGWCPPPSVVPADEMDRLHAHLTPEQLELVTLCYRRDGNAVPAEYVLQPRRGDYAVQTTWEPLERELRSALATAAEHAGFDAVTIQKYRASATEQEILKGAMGVSDAAEHVFAFFRSVRNLDDVKAALPAEAASAVIDTLPDRRWDARAWSEQERLRSQLAGRLGAGNVWSYEAEWKDGTLDLAKAMPDFCEAVWQRLSRVLTAEMDELERARLDSMDLERHTHAGFAEDRRRVFFGRGEPLRRIAEYLGDDSARPLVVHGPSGSGKSALIARAVADARSAHPGAVVIERYVGASLGSSEIRPLLESVCREISSAFGIHEEAITSYPKLVAALPRRLAMATPDRPLFVFLDAVDQLGKAESTERTPWLPKELPPNARLVISMIDAPPSDDLVEVGPMSLTDGALALESWLATPQATRTLTALQRQEVLDSFQHTGLPLHLQLLVEEARRWTSYDGTSEGGLPRDVLGIIRRLFERLSRPEEHGSVVTARALAFLAAARHGLSDDEMLDLLWRDREVRSDFEAHKAHDVPEGMDGLPPVVWFRLYADLAAYLTERTLEGAVILSFRHCQIAQVAADCHLGDEDRLTVHRGLADYFESRWRRPDAHAMLELVHQLARAHRTDSLAQLARTDFLDQVSSVVGFGAALDSGRAIAATLALDETVPFDSLLDAAVTYGALLAQHAASVAVFEELVVAGEIDRLRGIIENEPDARRKAELAVGIAVLLDESGGAVDAARIRAGVRPSIPNLAPYPLKPVLSLLVEDAGPGAAPARRQSSTFPDPAPEAEMDTRCPLWLAALAFFSTPLGGLGVFVWLMLGIPALLALLIDDKVVQLVAAGTVAIGGPILLVAFLINSSKWAVTRRIGDRIGTRIVHLLAALDAAHARALGESARLIARRAVRLGEVTAQKRGPQDLLIARIVAREVERATDGAEVAVLAAQARELGADAEDILARALVEKSDEFLRAYYQRLGASASKYAFRLFARTSSRFCPPDLVRKLFSLELRTSLEGSPAWEHDNEIARDTLTLLPRRALAELLLAKPAEAPGPKRGLLERMSLALQRRREELRVTARPLHVLEPVLWLVGGLPVIVIAAALPPLMVLVSPLLPVCLVLMFLIFGFVLRVHDTVGFRNVSPRSDVSSYRQELQALLPDRVSGALAMLTLMDFFDREDRRVLDAFFADALIAPEGPGPILARDDAVRYLRRALQHLSRAHVLPSREAVLEVMADERYLGLLEGSCRRAGAGGAELGAGENQPVSRRLVQIRSVLPLATPLNVLVLAAVSLVALVIWASTLEHLRGFRFDPFIQVAVLLEVATLIGLQHFRKGTWKSHLGAKWVAAYGSIPVLVIARGLPLGVAAGIAMGPVLLANWVSPELIAEWRGASALYRADAVWLRRLMVVTLAFAAILAVAGASWLASVAWVLPSMLPKWLP